jgi:hypothetical protein
MQHELCAPWFQRTNAVRSGFPEAKYLPVHRGSPPLLAWSKEYQARR